MTFGNAGDASRTCTENSNTYKNSNNVLFYDVKTEALQACLRQFRPTVVKIDIEGAELDILAERIDWGSTRVLWLEYSVARLRKMHSDGGGWKMLASLVEKLS